MSNAQEDAVFVRNFSLILVGLAIVGIVCFILAKIVNGYFLTTQNTDASASVRIAPVGTVNVGEPMVVTTDTSSESSATDAIADTDASADPGKAAYGKICFACHDAGIGGAPKIGDKATWDERMQKGVEMLVSNAINGIQGEAGIMPARGGLPDLSDDAVRAAVMHMLAQSGHVESGVSATPAAPEPDSAEPAAVAPAATTPEAATAAVDNSARGKEVYDSACFICHATGVAGAPKLGDTAAWASRIEKGMETLYEHSIKGFMGEGGLMPPKGGRPDFSDEDVNAAVDYMVSNSQ